MEARKGFRIFTYMRKRKNTGFKHKLPNLFFKHEGKTWEVIHKTPALLYAVELSTKGKAQGAVLRFPVESVVTTR